MTQTRFQRRMDALLRSMRERGFEAEYDGRRLGKVRVTPRIVLACSCCGESYEPKLGSRTLGRYMPLNWCGVCRERYREGEVVESVLESCSERRRGRRAKIRDSERWMTDWLLKHLPRWMTECLT